MAYRIAVDNKRFIVASLIPLRLAPKCESPAALAAGLLFYSLLLPFLIPIFIVAGLAKFSATEKLQARLAQNISGNWQQSSDMRSSRPY